MNDVKLGSAEIAPQARSASSSRTTEFEQNSVKTTTTESSQASQVSSTEASQQAAEEQQAPIAQQDVKQAVTSLNDYVQNIERDLEFSLDDDSGKMVVTVIDKETSEVVRQIPDEVALRLAQDLQQDEPLSLFNAKV